jgi:hypothetical protein
VLASHLERSPARSRTRSARGTRRSG